MATVTESVTTVAVAIVGLAALAVVVSRNARTTDIIDSGGKAYNNALATAISPVTNPGNGGFNSSTLRVFG